MNYLYKIIFLIGFMNLSGQNKIEFQKSDSTFLISNFEKFDTAKEGKKLRDLYNLDDKSLIIKLDSGKNIILVNNKMYFVKSTIAKPFEIKQVEDTVKLRYNKIIDSLKLINPLSLNEIKNKDGDQLNIQDGSERKIEFFKGDYKLELNSYAIENYIDFGVLNLDKRIKFLKFYNDLNKTYYDSNYKKLFNQDTLYVFFKKDKFQLKNFYVREDITKINGSIDYFFSSKYSSLNFYLTFMHSDKNQITVKKNKFLKQNKSRILDYTFFNNYNSFESFNLFKNKVVYLIDKDEIKFGKLILKRVKVSSSCCDY